MKKTLFLFFIVVFFSINKYCKYKKKRCKNRDNTSVEKQLTTANQDLGITHYSLESITSHAIHEAALIETPLTATEEKCLMQMSPNTIKAALLIIFTYTLQKICNVTPSPISTSNRPSSSASGQGSLFSFSFSFGSSKKNASDTSSNILQDNIDTISREFENSHIIKEISHNADTLISIISKLCSQIIRQGDTTQHSLSEKNNFYDIKDDILFYNIFERFLATIYGIAIKDVFVAEVILFGIKNFKSEISSTLHSFSTSICFKNLVTASTTKPELFKMHKNSMVADNKKEGARIPEQNIEYQKASFAALTNIAKLAEIDLTINNVIIPNDLIK